MLQVLPRLPFWQRNPTLINLTFFELTLGSDLVDLWAPAVTMEFQKELSKTLMTISIKHTFATVRHFGSWLHAIRPLMAGDPFKGVGDLLLDDPDWNGLTDRQILLLK